MAESAQPDFSQFSDADLAALSEGHMQKMSDAGLAMITNLPTSEKPATEKSSLSGWYEKVQAAANNLLSKGAEKKPSGYAGVKDADLNLVQKAEKAAENIGLVQPGEEEFSNNAMDAKKAALPYIAGATGAVALGASPMAPAILHHAFPTLTKGIPYAAAAAIGSRIEHMLAGEK